jgi:predicted thioesterase
VPTSKIAVGAQGTFTMPVTREVTVAHFHPEMPEVLGTPFLVYAMEVAASNAIVAALPPGWVSVGVKVDVVHLAATPVGFQVTARAQVTAVDDQGIHFRVEAHDGAEKIGEGTHIRAAVQLDRFGKRLERKAAAPR